MVLYISSTPHSRTKVEARQLHLQPVAQVGCLATMPVIEDFNNNLEDLYRKIATHHDIQKEYASIANGLG